MGNDYKKNNGFLRYIPYEKFKKRERVGFTMRSKEDNIREKNLYLGFLYIHICLDIVYEKEQKKKN